MIGSAVSPSIAAAFLQPVVVCSYGLSVPKMEPEGSNRAHSQSLAPSSSGSQLMPLPFPKVGACRRSQHVVSGHAHVVEFEGSLLDLDLAEPELTSRYYFQGPT